MIAISPAMIDDDVRALQHGLALIESRLAAMGPPVTLWEKEVLNTYHGVAEGFRQRLHCVKAQA